MTDRVPSSVSDQAAETAVLAQELEHGVVPPVPARSESIFRRRFRKFRRIKRGYWSFLFITAAYLLSFGLPYAMNSTAFLVRYEGRYYVPALRFYPATTFGQQAFGETDYRALKAQFEEAGGR